MSLLGTKRAIVVGCGSFGSAAASALYRLGYKTTVIDMNESSFSRLNAEFDGETVTGDGTCAEILKDCGAATASVLVCATNRDTANMLAAEAGSEILGCANVFARVKNEALAEVLEVRDVEVVCPQRAFVKEFLLQAGLDSAKAGIR